MATTVTDVYDLPQEHKDFRDTIRQMVTERVAPRAAEIDATGEYPWDVRHLFAEQDILALPFATEHGGTGTGSLMLQVAVEEIARACASSALILMVQELGTLPIQLFGSDELKQRFLPRCATGEWSPAFALSEPEAGSDPASMRMNAVLDESTGEWVINGQKMWTSLIQYADWIWMACRTDPDLPRHKGLSMILVPADAKGFSYTPVHTIAGVGTSATYYDDVRVPADNLIGERGGGWALITNQLNRERVALTSSAPTVHSIELVTDWARQTKDANGVRVIDQQWVQILLGRAQAHTEALTLMGWKLASEIDTLSPADASAIKVYGSELAVEVYRALMEIVGPAAGVAADSPGAVLAGRLERYFRSSLVMTFGGGTNEIQRDIIGYVGLGLPAATR